MFHYVKSAKPIWLVDRDVLDGYDYLVTIDECLNFALLWG